VTGPSVRRRPAAVVFVAAACLASTACAGAGPAAVAPTHPRPTLGAGPGTQTGYTVRAQPTAGSCHFRFEGADPLPDPACTPGAINPRVTQANIQSTICRPGWTATVRPPVSVTGPEKLGSARAYGYTGPLSIGEYDHLVPLELGGDPNDPSNLWLEPNDDPDATSTHNAKDVLENRLRHLVCSGRISLSGARSAIAADWVAAARRFGG